MKFARTFILSQQSIYDEYRNNTDIVELLLPMIVVHISNNPTNVLHSFLINDLSNILSICLKARGTFACVGQCGDW